MIPGLTTLLFYLHIQMNEAQWSLIILPGVRGGGKRLCDDLVLLDFVKYSDDFMNGRILSQR